MLKRKYDNDIFPKLSIELGYVNKMQIPKITKVCVNIGFGSIMSSDDRMNVALQRLSLIVGQKPVFSYAKKSIASFKIREGNCIGCKVTLRRNIMYFFLEKLIYIALPRQKDFKGFSKKQFDGNGNFSFGIQEHIIFYEVEKFIDDVFGMDITVVTNTYNDGEALRLLSCFGFPFFDL